MAEPGVERLLGRDYGGRAARIEDVQAALDDLAVHPATARHIARKLATHFVADAPDPGVWWRIWRRRSSASGGDLMAVYAALLEHPASWEQLGAKVAPAVRLRGGVAARRRAAARGWRGASRKRRPTRSPRWRR